MGITYITEPTQKNGKFLSSIGTDFKPIAAERRKIPITMGAKNFKKNFYLKSPPNNNNQSSTQVEVRERNFVLLRHGPITIAEHPHTA